MNCKFCGKEIRDMDKFCQYCGNRVLKEEGERTESSTAFRSGNIWYSKEMMNDSASVQEQSVYCNKCGRKVAMEDSFCCSCGYPTKGKLAVDNAVSYKDSTDEGNAKQKKKRWIICGSVAIVASFLWLAISLIVSVTQSDADKLIGVWNYLEGDNFYEVSEGYTFYEPYEEDGSSGDAEYREDGDIYYGYYELHESSKRLTVYMRNKWGTYEDMTFSYKFTNNKTLILTMINNPDSVFEFEKE